MSNGSAGFFIVVSTTYGNCRYARRKRFRALPVPGEKKRME
jgi:hypothetical protein